MPIESTLSQLAGCSISLIRSRTMIMWLGIGDGSVVMM
jgi:hypothetical protein